jgi:hypothetical protein
MMKTSLARGVAAYDIHVFLFRGLVLAGVSSRPFFSMFCVI